MRCCGWPPTSMHVIWGCSTPGRGVGSSVLALACVLASALVVAVLDVVMGSSTDGYMQRSCQQGRSCHLNEVWLLTYTHTWVTSGCWTMCAEHLQLQLWLLGL